MRGEELDEDGSAKTSRIDEATAMRDRVRRIHYVISGWRHRSEERNNRTLTIRINADNSN